MNILSIKDVTKQGRDKPLFSGVTFGLNSGDKAALIGRNGCGKSTLLSCIAGLLPADDGTIVTAKQCGISYLPQNPIFQPEDTIRSYIFDDGNSKLALIRTYEDLCSRTAACTGEIPVALQQEYDTVTEEMNRRDLWNYESRIRQILTTLGITDFNRPMKTLSGGMIKKTALAQVLVDDTGLLLLDEPTNQLDIQSIAWLEDYLRNTDRAVLMVTHDRYFLDNVCSSIYELERGRLQLYSGNYSTYLEKKETEALIQENTERRIESVLRTEREWLMRGPQARGTKARARVDAIFLYIQKRRAAGDFWLQRSRKNNPAEYTDRYPAPGFRNRYPGKKHCIWILPAEPGTAACNRTNRRSDSTGIHTGCGRSHYIEQRKNLICSPDAGTIRV